MVAQKWRILNKMIKRTKFKDERNWLCLLFKEIVRFFVDNQSKRIYKLYKTIIHNESVIAPFQGACPPTGGVWGLES
jgi:hypothetical protein